MAISEPGRVLSIQSHVVAGYVGNRAATFPLQTLGYDVDVINSVQFSNHTGYGHTNGHKTTPEQLVAIFKGLSTNDLIAYSRVLTGYVPGAEALRVVAEQIEKMKADNPDIIYVLDPVMGDVGKGLYVSEDVVPVYKDMLRLSTIITPNQFETELLSGIPISSLSSLHASLRQLHTVHSVPHIALSSIPLPISLVSTLDLPSPPSSYRCLLPEHHPPEYDAVGAGSGDDEALICLASTWHDGDMDTWAFALPTIRAYFSGVGDLFSAMVLAHFDTPHASSKGTPSFTQAVSRALLTVQQILLRTHLFAVSNVGPSGAAISRSLHHSPVDGDGRDSRVERVTQSDGESENDRPTGSHEAKPKAKTMRMRELRIIQERALLDNANQGWPGRKLDWAAILA